MWTHVRIINLLWYGFLKQLTAMEKVSTFHIQYLWQTNSIWIGWCVLHTPPPSLPPFPFSLLPGGLLFFSIPLPLPLAPSPALSYISFPALWTKAIWAYTHTNTLCCIHFIVKTTLCFALLMYVHVCTCISVYITGKWILGIYTSFHV